MDQKVWIDYQFWQIIWIFGIFLLWRQNDVLF